MVAVPLMFASNNPAWRILPLVNLRLVHLVFLLRLSSILLVHDSVLAALSLWQHDGLQWIRIHIAGINLVCFFLFLFFFFSFFSTCLETLWEGHAVDVMTGFRDVTYLRCVNFVVWISKMHVDSLTNPY